MNCSVWVAWLMNLLCAVISLMFLMGKGSLLIAGYNTSTREIKATYNVKRLCRVVGGGFSVITIILVIYTIYEFDLPSYLQWMMPWGFFAVIAFIAILANSVCKKK
ncbi:MAG TPA: DUF3784 domain-containing protein [Clostridiales bacterium]|nr:DUF3784 domain-containing protein [Clostridiales bacterium]